MCCDCSNVRILTEFDAYLYFGYQKPTERDCIIAGINRKDSIEVASIGKPTNIPFYYAKSATIENTLVHETIHRVINELIGINVSNQFDNLAYPNRLNLGIVLERV